MSDSEKDRGCHWLVSRDPPMIGVATLTASTGAQCFALGPARYLRFVHGPSVEVSDDNQTWTPAEEVPFPEEML